MSHEMRTPFASFYGLLGLRMCKPFRASSRKLTVHAVAETDLDSEQRELGKR
jgi:hypothetical protein